MRSRRRAQSTWLTGLRDWAQPLPFSACQVLTPENSQGHKASARFPLAVQEETIEKHALTLACYLLLLRNLLDRRDRVDVATVAMDDDQAKN